MGLMQLLKMGQSLSEARDRPNHYKVRSGALPIFGVPGGAEVGPKSDLEARPPGEREDATDKAGVVVQTMKATTATTVESKRAARALTGGRWALKVNPFRATRIAPVKESVQGELLLDKVKPVRNDLTDSDLELVAATKPAASAQSAVKIESEEVPVVKLNSMWARFRGLFHRGS